MSKNKNEPKMIKYAGVSLMIDTIAGFHPTYEHKVGSADHYGIKFFLRSGEVVQPVGNSKVLRDRVLSYLHGVIKTIDFPSLRCDACLTFEQDPEKPAGTCVWTLTNDKDKSCRQYDGLRRFAPKSEEECTAILSPPAPKCLSGQ